MKILNKLDTTKGIALVGFLVVLAILVGAVSSGTMFGPVFYGIAAAGLVFQLFLVFRGTGRRIHTVKLQNERLEKELELAKGLLQTVEHASNANVKNAESLMGSVRTINNIAGSVSKARAVQAGMQNVVNEISNVVLTHSGAAQKNEYPRQLRNRHCLLRPREVNPHNRNRANPHLGRNGNSRKTSFFRTLRSLRMTSFSGLRCHCCLSYARL